ncbi:inositol 1,4,5-triphosphate receptor associated 2-like isoform X2 [Dermacentor silvarum]|uniref:inositol 1,4,5-triphosphate receptor associated 2-like isoform X2 n=1 Tax=Dermacentor silvarum TaxID=543639 RepID=UPI002100D198|nr:inositol 1,4,5-triphosphate receptor associated 2-like isoform X2 [Dermacentor silvarum]
MGDEDKRIESDLLPPEGMILPSDGLRSPPPENGSGGETEDSFEGEGTEEVKTDKPVGCAVKDALHRLVELCDAPEDGLVTLDKLMAVIESQGFQCSAQDEQSLNQVYTALWAESESKGLVTNGTSGKRDVHVDIHGSKVIRNLLDDYQRNAHLEDIWEPGLSVLLDSSKSGGGLPTPGGGGGPVFSTPLRCTGGGDDGAGSTRRGGGRASGCSTPSTCSSAEILASLEVSMFSCGSKEGIAGDFSFLDAAQMEAERCQFQHTVQRLIKEKEDAFRQWSQVEEANQALTASNKDLLERVRSLCQEVEALRSASVELEETKAALTATSAAREQAEQQLVQARAAKVALQSQLEKRIAEVDSLQERLTKSQVREKKASEAVAQNRVRLRELEKRNLSLKEQLSQESSRLVESTAAVQDLSKTVETLEQRQKDTEDELRQKRAENVRLREVLYEQTALVVSDSSTITGTELHDTSPAAVAIAGEANLDSDEGVRSISPASILFLDLSSSPQQPISDELLFSALDLPCASTPQQSLSKRPRMPFCGIPRLPSWDCSMIQRRHSDAGVNSVLLNQSGHSSLPSGISALVPENLASSGEEALRARLEQELERKEEVIRELEAKIVENKEEQLALERRQAELCSFLGLSLVVLRTIRCDLQALNDEAVRVLESQAGAASVLALAQQDRQLVSALEDVSPESAYSFPEDVVREQIQLELQTLRAQITKSQAVLTYLQSRGSRVPLQPSSECATIDRKALVPHRGYSEEGVHPDDRHYDTLETHRTRRPSGCHTCGCIGRCRGRHAGRFSSTLSCPTLLSRDSPVARGTQTELAASTRSRDCQTEPLAIVDVPCDRVSVEQEELPDEGRTPVGPDSALVFPRHRSNSFVCAIQGGNFAAVEASDGSSLSREIGTVDSGNAKPPVPKLTFEDFDAQRREPDVQTRKAAFRKCLLEVGRSVAMDLDQPDGSSRVPLKKTTFMLERPETESAQGSLEGLEAFPSFSDVVLASQGVSKDSPGSDQLTEEEIENKFTTLSLGFKTDRLTLTKRLELHQRHRDIAEGNIQAELNAIRDLAQTLDSLCTDDERVREVVAQIRNHVDVIQQSTDRVSSQAEVYGAVQQEERMSRAFEVMVAHVENLKRASEREHRELEDARKLLLDHQLHDVATVTPAKDSRGRLFSIPGGSAASSSAPGPVRALRALNLGARRCSLPVPHAVLLPTAHEADAARAADAAAGAKSECHVEEEVVGSSAKADGSHHHGARDVNGDVGVSSLSAHEHSGHIAEESSTLQNGVLEELVAASAQDTLELSDRLNGMEEMDADELRAREGEEGDQEFDGEEREGSNTRVDCANIDLLHWAANVVVRVKYWLNRSRQVLAGRKRLAPVTVQRFTTARYFLSGLLVTAALVTALVVLLPGVTPCSHATNDGANVIQLWHDLCLWGPDFVTLHRGDRPPPT